MRLIFISRRHCYVMSYTMSECHLELRRSQKNKLLTIIQMYCGLASVLYKLFLIAIFVQMYQNNVLCLWSVLCLNIFQIYLHNVLCAGHKARILRLFLSLGFIMMSLLCSLARYGLYYNHWVDVAVGYGLGTILAVYIVSRPLVNSLISLSNSPPHLRSANSFVSSPPLLNFPPHLRSFNSYTTFKANFKTHVLTSAAFLPLSFLSVRFWFTLIFAFKFILQ